MRRRAFITLASGAAAWPIAARAESAALPVVGLLVTGNHATFLQHNGPAFFAGLSESGYVDGRNVHMEFRSDEGRYDLLPKLVGDLIELRASVVAAVGGDTAALAARAATASVPIVFAIGGDPVMLGLVPNLYHPGGHITGATWFTGNLAAKRLGLLRAIAPAIKIAAILVNPDNPRSTYETNDFLEASHAVGFESRVLKVSQRMQIEPAIFNLSETQGAVLLVTGDAFYGTSKIEIAEAAKRHRIPAMFSTAVFTEAGGLMSYGASLPPSYHQAGAYVGRILHGAKPGELPIVLPTEFEFVVNLPAAKSIDLKFPEAVLALADRVIE